MVIRLAEKKEVINMMSISIWANEKIESVARVFKNEKGEVRFLVLELAIGETDITIHFKDSAQMKDSVENILKTAENPEVMKLI